MVICLERGADLHMVQLMPLPLTVSCFSKIQIGFYLSGTGSPGQRAVKRVCVCVCAYCIAVCWCIIKHYFYWQIAITKFLAEVWLHKQMLAHLGLYCGWEINEFVYKSYSLNSYKWTVAFEFYKLRMSPFWNCECHKIRCILNSLFSNAVHVCTLLLHWIIISMYV